MRHYEPIWLVLKQKGTVKVVVPKCLHRRTIKAVMKEKNMDGGYKFMLSENSQRCRLNYVSEEDTIIFTLRYSIGESDL